MRITTHETSVNEFDSKTTQLYPANNITMRLTSHVINDFLIIHQDLLILIGIYLILTRIYLNYTCEVYCIENLNIYSCIPTLLLLFLSSAPNQTINYSLQNCVICMLKLGDVV